MIELKKLTAIGCAFRLEGTICSYEVITTGNINTTVKVTYERPDQHRKSYIFQKINTYVFRDPEGIMENIDLVTEHIRKHFPDEITLHFHHTAEGKNFLYDEDGGFWRVMNYVESISFDTCEDLAVIRSTGEAFGRFQNQLADLDGALLHETIPDFHNTVKRLDTLFRHVEEDPLHRNADAKEEIDYLASVRREASALSELYNQGQFPVRVTHNDTKSNNVLFDPETRRPLLVIDLDTVMPGMSVYDFGDAVRFICNTAAEDEPDPGKVSFDVSRFRAFCEGFLGTVGDSLEEVERRNLVSAAFSITIELAARFLDDYLTGDAYFKVNYPGHNLVRTRCQLALAKDIWAKKAELEKICEALIEQ